MTIKTLSVKMIAVFTFLLLFAANTYATHMIGWELSYRYLGNNNYKLTATIYRDCYLGEPNAIAQDIPLYYGIFQQQGVSYNFFKQDSLGNNLLNGPIGVNNLGYCVIDTNTRYCSNYVQVSATLTLPPGYSYLFVNQRCCLSNFVNIVNSSNPGVTMLATIPAGYNNSSAVFNHPPPFRYCQNMPFEMDCSATDPDGDSLAYRMVSILSGGSPNDAKPLPHAPPYDTLSFTPPFTAGNPLNDVFSLDERTGIIKGRCRISGHYMMAVACDEYRNGVKINTVVRAYAPMILPCAIGVKADAYNDSLQRVAAQNSNLIAAQCGGNKTVDFTNHSIGAVKGYRWDFGDTQTLQDTSSLANPRYTYPDTGKYLVTLVAYGQDCNDTLRGDVIISDDVVNVDFTTSSAACIYDTIYAQDNSFSNGSAITQYAWLGKDVLSFDNPAAFYFIRPGQQTLVHYVTTANGCMASAAKTFTLQQATISACDDTAVVAGGQAQLFASGGVSYFWTALSYAAPVLDDPASPAPILYCAQPGTFLFSVLGTDDAGCKGRDTVRVTVSKDAYVYVPTGFTPNGDGRNDVLKVFTSGCTLQEFQVYNRQGKRLFSTTDRNTGWDGRYNGADMPTDTYFWTVVAKNGKPGTAVYRGVVTLLR